MTSEYIIYNPTAEIPFTETKISLPTINTTDLSQLNIILYIYICQVKFVDLLDSWGIRSAYNSFAKAFLSTPTLRLWTPKSLSPLFPLKLLSLSA